MEFIRRWTVHFLEMRCLTIANFLTDRGCVNLSDKFIDLGDWIYRYDNQYSKYYVHKDD